MAETNLSTVSGAGEQAATQSPQSVPAAAGLGGPAATNIQSGAANSLQGGTQLTNNSLSTIKLNDPISTNAKTQAETSLPKFQPAHRFSPLLLSVPAILILLAVGMAWFMAQSAKNTTEY